MRQMASLFERIAIRSLGLILEPTSFNYNPLDYTFFIKLHNSVNTSVYVGEDGLVFIGWDKIVDYKDILNLSHIRELIIWSHELDYE